MQRLSRELHQALVARVPVRAVLWGGTNAALPLFGGLAATRAASWLFNGAPVCDRSEIILAGDVSLAPLAVLLGRAFDRAVGVIAHGKDVLFNRFGYQSFVAPWMRQCDVVIGISAHARQLAVAAGVALERTTVAGCAVDAEALPDRASARHQVSNHLGRTLGDRPVVLSVSRIVRRKGISWFVRFVWPRIIAVRPDALFIAIGDGPEMSSLRSAAAIYADSVVVTGRVSDEMRLAALAASDLFVMPNLPTENDTEGFGLVAAEAAHAGLPTIATALEGLSEAVIPERTGLLVPVESPDEMASAVIALLNDPNRRKALSDSARASASERFIWSVVGDRYVDGLQQGVEYWRSRQYRPKTSS